jgi:hypothetical protein
MESLRYLPEFYGSLNCDMQQRKDSMPSEFERREVPHLPQQYIKIRQKQETTQRSLLTLFTS